MISSTIAKVIMIFCVTATIMIIITILLNIDIIIIIISSSSIMISSSIIIIVSRAKPGPRSGVRPAPRHPWWTSLSLSLYIYIYTCSIYTDVNMVCMYII